MDTRIDISRSSLDLGEIIARADASAAPVQPAATELATAAKPAAPLVTDAQITANTGSDSMILDRLPILQIAESPASTTKLNASTIPDPTTKVTPVTTAIHDRTSILASAGETLAAAAEKAAESPTVSTDVALKLLSLEDMILYKLNPVVVDDPTAPPPEPPSFEFNALPGVQWELFNDYAKPYDPKADDTVAGLAQLFRTISNVFRGAINVTTHNAFNIMDWFRQKFLPSAENEKSNQAKVEQLAARVRVTNDDDRQVRIVESTDLISIDGVVRHVIDRTTATETPKQDWEDERKRKA